MTDQENRPEADADAAPAHTTATTPPTTELPVEGPNDLPSILAAPDLPLWNGPDPATGERPERSDDTEILDNIGAIQEAWEAVRAEGRTGTAHDLVAALDVELTALRRALDGPNA
ncbi:hypothetical protein, partial [Streptomyces griseolus]|uniref:hypothetical protein n=1 Tax=Streptomyces griseolus TaxID=1909 RepID=UPI001ADEF271